MIKNRCPICNSTLTYLRTKISEFICRKCGATWPRETSNSNPEKQEVKTDETHPRNTTRL